VHALPSYLAHLLENFGFGEECDLVGRVTARKVFHYLVEFLQSQFGTRL
jgi:hypothetical protein